MISAALQARPPLAHPLAQAATWAVALALAGCAAGPSAPAGAASARQASVAGTVEFRNEVDPLLLPARLVIQVADERGVFAVQQVADAWTRVPGHHARFSLRFDLPPGRYSIRRIAGTTAKTGVGQQFDLPLQLDFEAATDAVRYIGRIQVTARARRPEDDRPMNVSGRFADAAAQVRLEDRLDEDWPPLVQAWPGFRGQVLQSQLATYRPDVPATAAAAAAPAGSGNPVPPAPLGSHHSAQVPPPWRTTFQRFLARAKPRAMAVAASGAAAAEASGPGAVGAALSKCRQRSPLAPCRLFAVDDTLLDDNISIVLTRLPPAPR